METAFVFLATGFEEMEATSVIDVLRRAEIPVKSVSITGDKTVVGSHNIPVVADCLFEEADLENASALILPGGMPGATNLNAHQPLRDAILRQNEKGKVIAAICAAPLVFGDLGVLQGRKAVCYPGFEKYLKGAIVPAETPIQIDGNIITANGPRNAALYGLAIVSVLKDEQTRNNVASGMLF